MQLAQIYRYPVKALPGERLDKVSLTAAEGLPHDRRFALTNMSEPAPDGEWMPCRSFFINALHDGLAQFSQTFDEASGKLTIASHQGSAVSFTAGDGESQTRANASIPALLEPLQPETSIPPMIAERRQVPGAHSGFWDFTDSALSIINLASVDMLSKAMGVELDPRRFRGNLLIDGLAPWEEFSWLGKRISIGEAELEIIRPAQRCPATSVNPETALRDLKVPDCLQTHFGHAFLGMYAQVTKGGLIAPGESINISGAAHMPPDQAAAEGPDYRLWPRMAEVVDISSHGEHAEEAGCLMSLRPAGPWLLPEARPGQRLRIHLGPDLYTAAEISDHRDHTTVLHVTPSQTGDRATAHLLEQAKTGDRLVVTGPFGRPG
ncbi:MOSC domain-containing protein [Salaquimonas pukyongi]|uniref:MOSC domain-containing protein n=1 Tax=Salaquimonas pukyongi TaxID=2712698 RepID=UPI00096B6A15|nr:MOSC domain-containing protein [Salaquimonas pukyongi]